MVEKVIEFVERYGLSDDARKDLVKLVIDLRHEAVEEYRWAEADAGYVKGTA